MVGTCQSFVAEKKAVDNPGASCPPAGGLEAVLLAINIGLPRWRKNKKSADRFASTQKTWERLRLNYRNKKQRRRRQTVSTAAGGGTAVVGAHCSGGVEKGENLCSWGVRDVGVFEVTRAIYKPRRWQRGPRQGFMFQPL